MVISIALIFYLHRIQQALINVLIKYHYKDKDTIMYVHPITRQTFNYATPIECGNNPQHIIELDPDSDNTDFYCFLNVFSTPGPLKKD